MVYHHLQGKEKREREREEGETDRYKNTQLSRRGGTNHDPAHYHIVESVFHEVRMLIESPNSGCSLVMTDYRNSFIGGFVGPDHNPTRRMFSAFILSSSGRLRMDRKTGHKLHDDDLLPLRPC